MILRLILPFIICVCLTAGLAAAQEPLPRTSGLSGYIEILGAYISTNSQLSTDSDNRKTDSLDNSGERVGKFRPFPLGLIRYTFAEYRTQLFLGVLPENVAQGQFQVEAGARHVLTNGTGLRASVIPLTPITQKTWEDPSLTPELSFIYFGSQLQASVNVSAKGEWYDRRHPVFDKKRRECAPGLFAILGYKNQFGFKKFRVDWFNAFFKGNSNIDFYDSSNSSRIFSILRRLTPKSE